MQRHNGHICLILHHCVFPQSALSDFHSVAILTWKRVWYFGTLHRYFNRTECLTFPIVSKICSQFYFQVSEHSKQPDGLLTQPRTAILFEANHNGSRPKDSLKKLTVGHQYFRQHLEKPKGSQYLKLNPGRFQLMCERPEVQYGTVVQVHVLRADNCPFPDLSLKELATSRLKMREDPLSIPDITSYFKYRKSCWFLEETEDGQFRCDCPIGHKGKVCKHELALNYLYSRIEVLPHDAALPLKLFQISEYFLQIFNHFQTSVKIVKNCQTVKIVKN